MFYKKNHLLVLFFFVILAFALFYYFLGNKYLMKEGLRLGPGDNILHEDSLITVISKADGVGTDVDNSAKYEDATNFNEKDYIDKIVSENDSNVTEMTDTRSEPKRKKRTKVEYHEGKTREDLEKNTRGTSTIEIKNIYDSAIKKYKRALNNAVSNSDEYARIKDLIIEKEKERDTIIGKTEEFKNRSPQSGGDLEFQYMMDRPRVC